MSTRVLAFTSLKGGVAKTTNSANVACALADAGQRVLAIDLDPQGGLSTSLGMHDPSMPEPDIYLGELLSRKRLEDWRMAAVQSNQPGCGPYLHVMPSGGEVLNDAEEALTKAMDGALRLHRLLEGTQDGYDWVVVDTPPSLGHLTFSAMFAASDVLICSDASALSFSQLDQVAEVVETAQSMRADRPLDLRGVLLAKVFESRVITRDMHDWVAGAGLPLCPVMIPHRQAVSDAAAGGVPIVLTKPDSAPAIRYRNLTAWLREPAAVDLGQAA